MCYSASDLLRYDRQSTGEIVKLQRAVLATLILAGCQDADKPSAPVAEQAPDPAAPGDLVAGPARDVALLANKAVLGFRADGGAFHAGYDVHDVDVRDG